MTWWNARSKRTQAILVIVGLLVLAAITSPKSPSGSSSFSTAPPVAASSSSAASAVATVAPTPTPTPSPVVLEGRGQTATNAVQLPGPMSMGTFIHQGRSNFAVFVYRGDQKDLLINTIGNYAGIRPLFYTEPVRFQIEADGSWSLTIIPVESGGTVTANGTGDWVGKYFTPPGTGAYRFTHNGKSNFAVYLHCGGQRQLIQNEIGVFNGSKIIQFGRAPCLWEVIADGAWAIAGA